MLTDNNSILPHLYRYNKLLLHDLRNQDQRHLLVDVSGRRSGICTSSASLLRDSGWELGYTAQLSSGKLFIM